MRSALFLVLCLGALTALSPGTALAQGEGMMYWTSRADGIYRSMRDGSRVKLLVKVPNADGLAVDATAGKIYWSVSNIEIAPGTDKIQRANLDGSGVQDVVTGLTASGDIALDLAAGKIYWTSQDLMKIQRANLDGSEVEDWITGVDPPDELALDTTEGKIYWGSSRAGTLQRANLNGTYVEGIASGGQMIMSLALDGERRKIYWAEAASGNIMRADRNGTNRELVITGLDRVDGIALDTLNHQMYWTEPGRLSRAHLDGSKPRLLVAGKTSACASVVTVP
jgi:hypothetical protein